MPTTYTNGLKLPDLGSIDWYNAYKNNIDILDPIVGTVNGVATTYAPISHNHDASEITSGTIDIARLPPAALERLTTVADQTARYALTTSTVQLGDTVKQLDTGIMYLVVDTTKLNSADGYVEYSAGTASKAIADEDGTSIKTGYGKLAGNQTWTGTNTYTGASAIRFNNTSYVSGTPSENIFYSTVQWGGYVNNTWSAPFTINNAVRTNGYSDISFRIYSQTSNTLTGFVHETNADASDISFRPIANGTHKLGSSTYQWSSVYAQTYYYNGTQWGLDKANNWTGSNIFTGSVILPAFGSINYKNYGIVTAYGYTQANNYYRFLRTTGTYNTDNTPDTSKPSFLTFRPNRLQTELMDNIQVCNDGTNNYLAPITTGVTDLGTSTNKWKTLNGINPGALSLPDYNSTAKVDISGSIIPDQYGNIVYTPTINGWLYVCFNISSATTSDSIFYIQAKDNNVANSSFVQTSWMPTSGTSSLAIFFPVVANKQFVMQINFSNYTIVKAHVIPCFGNV